MKKLQKMMKYATNSLTYGCCYCSSHIMISIISQLFAKIVNHNRKHPGNIYIYIWGGGGGGDGGGGGGGGALNI